MKLSKKTLFLVQAALIAAIYGETGAHTGLSQHTGLTTV